MNLFKKNKIKVTYCVWRSENLTLLAAVMTFRQNLLNFVSARAIVADVEEEYFLAFEGIGVSFTRIDAADIHPIYQVMKAP